MKKHNYLTSLLFSVILLNHFTHGWILDNFEIAVEDCGSVFSLERLTLQTDIYTECYQSPCNVKPGNFVTLTAEFDESNSPYEASSMSFNATWYIDGRVNSAYLDPYTCNANCITKLDSGLSKFSSQILVSDNLRQLPSKTGLLQFLAKSSSNVPLMCYNVPVTIL